MSLLDCFLEDAEWDLRRAEREMQRHVRLLDRHLQHLREELPPCCPCRALPRPPCPCQRPPGAPGHQAAHGRALPAVLDVERELASIRRRSNRMLNASQDHNVLAVMDVKGFDPEEVTVKVKDRKVQVLAEHEEMHSTAGGKEYNYKNIRKEITLPPGVSEDEVIYSLGPSSIVKIETAHKHCPYLLRL